MQQALANAKQDKVALNFGTSGSGDLPSMVLEVLLDSQLLLKNYIYYMEFSKLLICLQVRQYEEEIL